MRTERFSLPLSDPLETADGTIDTREGFLVRVELDGRAGLGEATPLPGWTESLGDCAAALEGVDDPVAAIEEGVLDDRPAARHGVSLAVLDARARRDGEPLYRHLGGPAERATVPVNATVGDSDRRVAVVDGACNRRRRLLGVAIADRGVDRDRRPLGRATQVSVQRFAVPSGPGVEHSQ